jgi:hypothetical protein
LFSQLPVDVGISASFTLVEITIYGNLRGMTLYPENFYSCSSNGMKQFLAVTKYSMAPYQHHLF